MQSANTGSGSREPVGRGARIVEDGECALGIAYETGHFWETIWNHPDNAELKAKRGSPHVLLPGDGLHVPPIEIKEEEGATEKRHRFQQLGIPLHVEFKVCEQGKPLAGKPYCLTIEGRHKSGTIPNSGIVKASMLPSDQAGILKVGKGSRERAYVLQFGRLDPAHTRSGAIARLRNMGYLDAECAHSDEARFLEALKAFQADRNLTISGKLDDDTARSLAQGHGS
jgi:hypothetical protein